MSRVRIGWWLALMGAVVSSPATAPAQEVANPHGESIGSCVTCHGADGWTPARIAPTFRHAERTFPLEGAHLSASCTSCHQSLRFAETSSRCASCHEDVHRAELGVDCARCHTTRSFDDQAALGRLHEETRFPLRGAHVVASCASCHLPAASGQLQYTNRATACVSCHRADYDAAAAPPHAGAGFPTECANCHTETAWRGAPFDHQATTFPLTGAHIATACTTCHADGVFRGRSTLCASCHQADYDATTTPPHAAAGFPTGCADCHSTAAWPGAPFDHGATPFPLTGSHQAVACASCHGSGTYRGLPASCVSCHQPDYDATTAPPHAAAGFSTGCADCHTTATWPGTPFDHATTAFPLSGGHQAVACASCHGDGVYRGRSGECVSCHQQDWDATTTPPHAAAGFPTTCTTCHTTAAWSGAPFDHATTAFPLTGGHQAVACASCHGDGIYQGRSTTCISCHQAEYAGTTDPPHAAAGYSTDCTGCHTTSGWEGADFDHAATQFPLSGAHLAASCASCHADGVFDGKPTSCISCHQPDYEGTTMPSHAAAGYSTDCTGCHSTATWQGATFDHDASQFPLTGSHRAVACSACHGDGVYDGRSTACASCHQADYNATANPPHGAAGFALTCEQCHTTTAWPGGTFDHAGTLFPLTGAHIATSCSSCHGDGIYDGRSTACVSCHQTDYAATTNPNHAAAQFPTTCGSCHTTMTWSGATFDHDATFFPIYSGSHRQQWTSCSDCHTAPTDFSVFTCTTCHTPSNTNNDHDEVQGYQYQSNACYSCHPRGDS